MIDELQALVAAVETPSLSRAADRLHITQSAVSRRLQQLESRLGGDVLDRTRRPPVLTPLGARVYERAKVVLEHVDALVSLGDESKQPHGRYRLGLSIGLGDDVLERIVARIHARFPDVRLDVRSDWGPALLGHLGNGALEAAVVLSPTSAPTPDPLQARPLGTVGLVVVQSRRDTPFTGAVRLADLATASWVLNPTGCGFRAALEMALGGMDGNRQVTVDALGSDVQLRLVAHGLGLGLVPEATLASSPHANDIRVVDVTDFKPVLQARLVHHGSPGPFRAVLDAIASCAMAPTAPGV
ncbi:LysR family transcriptional regulator [Luteibacter yeojuensis]|uniref:HTH lysR-type domain-containing protein n=1 Tax=Luteibacter yeojuensis TaxID=345309 RepID=A0A0F3K592_9GAMM|nr:LysR family transcriptional regulator [Luteibacter yeojuensis]KJV26142.1 hypothetical protein VI08_19105 [Luteibacter yeojuensis]